MTALELLAADVAAFKAEVYGKKPQVTATGRDFSRLGSLEGFDHIINETLLPSAAFRLVRDGTPVPVSAYTKSFGTRDPIRVADPALVFDWFADGATIILESLHRYSPPLRDFCRTLESDLSHATQVNAYITPPGAQGFATHVDSHDVFVAQVFGRKRWMVYAEDDAEGAGDPVIERELEVGECLYIPKGSAHAAATTASASAHLTIGILPTKWSQLEKELTSLLKRGDEVVAPEILERGDAGEIGAHLLGEMKAKLDDVSREELARRLARVLSTSRHHSLTGQLRRVLDARDIADSDEVTTRAEWARFDDPDGVVVILPDRELRFTARLAPALDVVLQEGAFRVIDLKPHLEEDERKALVARLIKEGLLEVQ